MTNINFDALENMTSEERYDAVSKLIGTIIAKMYLYGCFLLAGDKDSRTFVYSVPLQSEIGKDSENPWDSEPITCTEMVEEITEFTKLIGGPDATVNIEYRGVIWTKSDYLAIQEGRAVFTTPVKINDNKEDTKTMESTGLNTIQKHNNLNVVYRNGEAGPGGAYHDYIVVNAETGAHLQHVVFQRGPRKEPDSQLGVLDGDLLEIVRDRLKAFQAGPFACEENAKALEHVELALMFMNRRAEERASRGVLGTTKV